MNVPLKILVSLNLLLPLPALAQGALQDPLATPTIDGIGVLYNQVGNHVFGSDGSVSRRKAPVAAAGLDEPPGQDAHSFTRLGATTFRSDGVAYNTAGKTTLGSDGTRYRRLGNTLFGSDGSTYMELGNAIIGGDGKKYQKTGEGLVPLD